MIFKIGLTIVVLAAIVAFYILSEAEDGKLDEEKGSRSLPKQHDQLGLGGNAALKVKPKIHDGRQLGNVKDSEQNLNHEKDKIAEKNFGKDKVEDPVLDRPRDENKIGLQKDKIKMHGHGDGHAESDADQPTHRRNEEAEHDMIHLSVVACGERLPETMVMLKSARMLTKSRLYFHIFAEDHLHDEFNKQLDSWPDEYKMNVAATVKPITYPQGQKEKEWKNMFKPCATQRLFLPYILNIDALIYVDTDILFMRPLEDIWAFFKKFNSTQLAALTPEHEDPSMGWYNRFARHPYYGKLGVNSGVMLMNLTRLRNMNWIDHIIAYHKQYKLQITWGDQDLINIFFHHFPQTLYVYPCEWNYRADHCMYMSNCKTAEQVGVSVLHGSRSYFHIDRQPAFKAIYSAFRDYKLGENLQKYLVDVLKKRLEDTKHTPCGQISNILISQLGKQVNIFMNKGTR